MRVFFIGTVEFSKKMLETLLEVPNAKVVGVATKATSKFNADHSDLSDIAKQNNIPYKYVKDINNPKYIDWIKSLNPDVIYCFGWSSIIKKDLLELTELGVIGYHPAKLPQNRGRHPLIWALVLGLRETASTFFKMDEGADSGKILSQVSFAIGLEDDAQSLYEKMIGIAKEQVKEFTHQLASNSFELIEQNHRLSNYWRKRGKKDGEIDFRMSSESIVNLVRGLTKPYVGAHVRIDEHEFKVWSAKIGPELEQNREPGQVVACGKNQEVLVKTGNGSVWLLEHDMDKLPDINSYFQ